MHPLKNRARVAGLLYLLVTLTGPFVLLYVPGKLFVPGDANATAANILAHDALFRSYIVVGLLAELVFIATVLALYRLLESVHRELAMLMVIIVLISAPAAFIGVGNDFATLTLLRHTDFLAVFEKPQRDALTMLLINFDRESVYVAEMFWGLWLLPLGALVYRSRFLPRFLGVWLTVNGVAYIVMSTIGLVSSRHVNASSPIVMPILLGEVAFMLWLLIVGARASAPAIVGHAVAVSGVTARR
jgi:hypothetical protein